MARDGASRLPTSRGFKLARMQPPAIRACRPKLRTNCGGEVHRRLAQNSGQAMVDNLRMIMERRLVARDGIEPPTLRFSVACSTN
jgi:hypothetical protein